MGDPRQVRIPPVRSHQERFLECEHPRRASSQRRDRSRRVVLATLDFPNAGRARRILLVLRRRRCNSVDFAQQARGVLRDDCEWAGLYFARDRSLQGLRGASLDNAIVGLEQQGDQDLCPDRLDLRWRCRQQFRGGGRRTGGSGRVFASADASGSLRWLS